MVGITLDGKKITNAILDQIPRLDFCDVLVNRDDVIEYDDIVVLCRFSLVSLLNSERRIHKVKGYNSEYTNRLISHFDGQTEAFLFTVKGILYCDSFSLNNRTRQYEKVLDNLRSEMFNAEKYVDYIDAILALDVDNTPPDETTIKCHKHLQGLIGGPSLKTKLPSRKAMLGKDQNENDYSLYGNLVDWEESEEEKYADAYFLIVNTHGSWEAYIESLEPEAILHKAKIASNKEVVPKYENDVNKIIRNVSLKPYALLGC
jgi:hypothetical protein